MRRIIKTQLEVPRKRLVLMMKKITVLNRQKEKLVGVYHKADNKKQVVIVCHSWTSSKDMDIIRSLCESLRKNGINAFRFDFSGNGESRGKFTDSTLSKEIQDLRSVIGYFKKKGYVEIGIIGHSMAGGICILESAKDRRPAFVISISGTSDVSRFVERHFSKEQLEEVRKTGFTKKKTWQNKLVTVSRKFINDIPKHRILQEVKKIRVPILFVIGTADNVKMRKKAFNAARQPKHLIFINGADHNFTDKRKCNQMAAAIARWIKERENWKF